MANKASSAPLFGAPTKRQVADIQKHMKSFTDTVAKDPVRLREILRATGAIAPRPTEAPKS
jgi:hypothetical protein